MQDYFEIQGYEVIIARGEIQGIIYCVSGKQIDGDGYNDDDSCDSSIISADD